MKIAVLIYLLVFSAPLAIEGPRYNDATQSVTVQNDGLENIVEIQHTNYHIGDTLIAMIKITNLDYDSILLPDPNVYGIEIQTLSRQIHFGIGAFNSNDFDTRDTLAYLAKGDSAIYKGELILRVPIFTVSDSAYVIYCNINWSPYFDQLRFVFNNGKWVVKNSPQDPGILAYMKYSFIEGLSIFITR